MTNEFGSSGVLFVVATPIGNLGDITSRALEVLKEVDLIAAEDTRHSRKLLSHFGVNTMLQALHEHNESDQVGQLLGRIQKGQSVALISDAGTPLISDPGYRLVYRAQEQSIKVVPIPGPCAAITALSVAGLPTDRFCYEGFLPQKSGQRRSVLNGLANEVRTLVFYEAPHRIVESLSDMCLSFGAERVVVLAKELTKTFETVRKGKLGDLLVWVKEDPKRQKGEFVLIVEGKKKQNEVEQEHEKLLLLLMAELPLKKAAAIVSSLSGVKKSVLYDLGLSLKE